MNKQCCTCKKFYSLDNFYKDSSRKDGLYPRCKACLSEYDKKRKKERAEYLKKNKTKIAERHAKYCEDNKEAITKQRAGYRKANRVVLAKYNIEYSKKNRGKMRAHWAKRRARKQISDFANLEKIQSYYIVCSEVNDILGDTFFCVDHICPLSKGGLHHEDNLQILECELNQKKYNKWPLSEGEFLEYSGITL